MAETIATTNGIAAVAETAKDLSISGDGAAKSSNGSEPEVDIQNTNAPPSKRVASGDMREVKHVNGNSAATLSDETVNEHASTSNGCDAADGSSSKRRVALKRGPEVMDGKDLLPKGRDGGVGIPQSRVAGSSSTAPSGSRGPRQVTFQQQEQIAEILDDMDEDDDDGVDGLAEVDDDQASSEDDAEGNDGDIVADPITDDDGALALKAKVHALQSKYPQSFVTAEDTVFIRLVRGEADASIGDKSTDDKVSFKPPWVDVHLGEAAALFGYKKLRIDIAYTAGWLHAYVGITEEEPVVMPTDDAELREVMNGGNEDNAGKSPLQKISHLYPAGVTHHLEEFRQQILQDGNFKPFGALVSEYEAANTNNLKSTFCVHTCPITHDQFMPYFQRMQTFTLWFVDAAHYIDTEEAGWQIYTVYEKYEVDGRVQYGLVGYSNAYNFPVFIRKSHATQSLTRATANGSAAAADSSGSATFDEPKVRRRIAQFLILPPFQRRGHGIRLLDAIQRDVRANANVVSLTVEEPVPELTRMRLCVGGWQMLELNDLHDWLAQTIDKGFVTRDDVRALAGRLKLPLDVALCCVKMLIVKILTGMDQDEDAVEILKLCETQLLTKEIEDAQLAHRRLKMGKINITSDDEEEQLRVRSMWMQNVKTAVQVATTRFRESRLFAEDQLAVLKGLNAMMEKNYCDKLGMSICEANV